MNHVNLTNLMKFTYILLEFRPRNLDDVQHSLPVNKHNYTTVYVRIIIDKIDQNIFIKVTCSDLSTEAFGGRFRRVIGVVSQSDILKKVEYVDRN